MRTLLKLTAEERKVIFLSSLGGALEFYDFVIYMFFANVLNQLFFPSKDSLDSLMAVFAVFAVGYLIRPLGGVIFGHFGDKYGRKQTFVVTVMLMAVPTFLIGLLPTHHNVGISAAILLILLRILQGLAVGGEIPGAIIFAGEHVKPQYRGLTCSIIFFGLNMGMILGSAISVLMFHYLSNQQLLSWGWRLPFIFGGLLGVVSYYLRKYMTETPIFKQLHITEMNVSKPPIYTALRHHFFIIMQGMALTWLGAVIICLLFLYLPTYLTVVLHYSKSLVAILNTLNLILFSFLEVIAGAISDYVGRRIFLRIGSIAFMLGGYGIFYLLTLDNNLLLVLVLLTIAIFSSVITGTFPTTIMELFPTKVRYTGLAISYNIAFAIFGGLSPLIATYLIKVTGNNLAPSYYLLASALACFLATIKLRDMHGKSLSN